MAIGNGFSCTIRRCRVELLFVESGIARGCGWQRIGAYINLGAFYLCGNPAAVALGFWANLRGKGLWIGIQIGALVQTLLLAIVTCRINWKKQVQIFHFRFSWFWSQFIFFLFDEKAEQVVKRNTVFLLTMAFWPFGGSQLCSKGITTSIILKKQLTKHICCLFRSSVIFFVFKYINF